MENLDYKVLLEISRATATVRDSQDLLRVVMERIRPLFGFYDAGIFVVDKTGEFNRDLTVEMPEIVFSDGGEKLHGAGLGVKMPHRGSAIEAHIKRCRSAQSPLVFSFDEIFAEFPDHPFHEIMQQTGYAETMATLLRARGETIGIFYLNSLPADGQRFGLRFHARRLRFDQQPRRLRRGENLREFNGRQSF